MYATSLGLSLLIYKMGILTLPTSDGHCEDEVCEEYKVLVTVFITLPVCLVTSAISDSLQPYGPQPTRLLCPWNFPGKSTGVGCHFLLQGIFLTQGLNP